MRRTLISTTILASLVSGAALAVPVVEEDPAWPPGWSLLARDAEMRNLPAWLLQRGNESDPSGVEFQDGRNGNGLRYGQGAGAGQWDEMPTTLEDGWMLRLILPPVGQPPEGSSGSGSGTTGGSSSGGEGATAQDPDGQPPTALVDVPLLPTSGPVNFVEGPTTPVEVPEPATLSLLGLGLLGLGFARGRRTS